MLLSNYAYSKVLLPKFHLNVDDKKSINILIFLDSTSKVHLPHVITPTFFDINKRNRLNLKRYFNTKD